LFIDNPIWAYFGLDVEVGYRLEGHVKNTSVGGFAPNNQIYAIYKRESSQPSGREVQGVSLRPLAC
jgi:hypothetical protein